MKVRKNSEIIDYLIIIAGCLITALSFNLFFIPGQIAPGGLSGLGTVIYYLTGVPVGTVMLILNVPLFIFGIRQLGGSFGIKTLAATIMLSLFIDFVKVPPLTEDPLLASIYGGVMMGAGLGLILRKNATTGGTDLFAKLIHKHFHAISIAWVLFVVDCLVVVMAGVVFGPNLALYAVVALAINAKVIDIVQEGLNTAKAVIIISDKSELIAEKIMQDLDRGVTLLKGKGAYTGYDKHVILCIVNRMQMQALKNMITEIDRNAFAVVSDVREVIGEGF